jgi:hypothetical protein
MIELSITEGRVALGLTARRIGADWAVAICGGDSPHVGAVALAAPTCGGGRLALPGHREGEVAAGAAAELSTRLGAAVSVTCGIHVDGITPDEIDAVRGMVGRLVQGLIERAGGQEGPPPGGQ